MRERTFEVSSPLAVSPERFWQGATLASVNAELAPLVRMTAPAGWRTRPLGDWPAGRALFASWILLFGFLPIDRHSFFMHAIDPARGFEERSTSATNRRWWHTRTVTVAPGGCRVVDRLVFESRLPLAGWMLEPVYRAVFQHRHRVLKRLHGTGCAD